jgi:hypothetical protein
MATYQISERVQKFPYQLLDRVYYLQTTVPGAPGNFTITLTTVTDAFVIALIEAGIASWIFLQEIDTPQITGKTYEYTF